MVQLEKEAGIDLFNPKEKVEEAVVVYYKAVMDYSLNNRRLPRFRESVPIVVSGGLTLANGFVDKMQESLKIVDFPIKIKGIRRAKNPMTCVANGALLAAQI